MTPEAEMTPDVETARAKPERDNWRSALFQVVYIVPVIVYLVVALPDQRDDLFQTSVLLFIITVAVVDLIPVPAWGGMQLSLSFPILLGVAIIYPPPVAAVIAFLGSFDPRELRLQMPPLRAVFNRAQMAASTAAGSYLFHLVADVEDDRVGPLVLGVVIAAIAAYVVNA
jgi:hypothetical protein